MKDLRFDLEFYIPSIYESSENRIKAFAVGKYSEFYLLYSLPLGGYLRTGSSKMRVYTKKEAARESCKEHL